MQKRLLLLSFCLSILWPQLSLAQAGPTLKEVDAQADNCQSQPTPTPADPATTLQSVSDLGVSRIVDCLPRSRFTSFKQLFNYLSDAYYIVLFAGIVGSIIVSGIIFIRSGGEAAEYDRGKRALKATLTGLLIALCYIAALSLARQAIISVIDGELPQTNQAGFIEEVGPVQRVSP